ncbi:MAG TPA: hypothetical protein VIT91_17840 [Chthoniobacterales bacterium]
MHSLRIFSIVSIILTAAGCAPKPHSSNSDTSGKPSWFPLGEEVYHENDLLTSQKETLKFIPESRWFKGFPKRASKVEYQEWQKRKGIYEQSHTENNDIHQIPSNPTYPEKVTDLPLEDQGVTLKLSITNTATSNELTFALSLTTGARSLKREVEHRWTNMTPFLFAFFANGKAISQEPYLSSKSGGANYFWELVPLQSKREWKFKVDTSSIDTIVGSETQNLIIVAAFSERQHEAGASSDFLIEPLMNTDDYIDQQITIRSNTVRIRRTVHGWESPENILRAEQ